MAKDVKKTQNKNSVKESKEKNNKESAKSIEKETTNKEEKKKVKKEKKNNEKIVNFLKTVDNNRWPIILFIVGFLLATLIFRCIFWPDRIATLKDGTQPVAKLKDETITADDLYEDMKEYYSVNTLLNTIDDLILSKMYPSNDVGGFLLIYVKKA